MPFKSLFLDWPAISSRADGFGAGIVSWRKFRRLRIDEACHGRSVLAPVSASEDQFSKEDL